MRKVIFAFALSIAFSQVCSAQARSAYVELFGPGLTSVNYDTRFTKSEGGIGGRIGVGYFKIDDASLLLVPAGVNYLLSKNQRNYFEIGGGATYVRAKDSYSSSNDVFNGSFGHLHFGYRLQPKEGGFMFRAGVTPLFGGGQFIPYYISLAFGYKF